MVRLFLIIFDIIFFLYSRDCIACPSISPTDGTVSAFMTDFKKYAFVGSKRKFANGAIRPPKRVKICVDPSWTPLLDQVTSADTLDMREALQSRTNALGVLETRGSFSTAFGVCLRGKEMHPSDLHFVPHGSRYVCFGVDAIVACHYTDISPDRKAVVKTLSGIRMGINHHCFQKKLFLLIHRHRLCVRVYEKRDARYACQQWITPADPIYMGICNERTLGATVEAQAQPIIAVLYRCGGGQGHLLMHMDISTKRKQIFPCLSTESVRCHLDTARPFRIYYAGAPPRGDMHPAPAVPINCNSSVDEDFIQSVGGRVSIDFYINMGDFHVDRVGPEGRPHPLHLHTARQLGVIRAEGQHPLVRHVLGTEHPPTGCTELVTNMLTHPPSHGRASIVRGLIRSTNDHRGDGMTIPEAMRIRRLVALSRRRPGTVYTNPDILQMVRRHIRGVLMLHDERPDVARLALRLQRHMCKAGTVTDIDNDKVKVLIRVMRQDAEMLDAMLPDDTTDAPSTMDVKIKGEFVTANERRFRGKVHPRVQGDLLELDECVAAINRVVQEAGENVRRVVYDKESRTLCADLVVSDRTLSEKLDSLCGRYTRECDRIAGVVEQAYQEILKNVVDAHMWSHHTSTELACVVNVAYLHAIHPMRRQQWTLTRASPSALHISGMWPFWMDTSRATANHLDMDELCMLTGPNMSGKSTLIRSTGACVLLGMCGFAVPARDMALPAYSMVYVRSSSDDCPLRNMSCFELEMSDVAGVYREMDGLDGARVPFVCIDEVGKGTSTQESKATVTAIFEDMRCRGYHGIFSTHMYDAIREQWCAYTIAQETHALRRGVCATSLARNAMTKHGMPARVVERYDACMRARDATAPESADPERRHDAGGAMVASWVRRVREGAVDGVFVNAQAIMDAGQFFELSGCRCVDASVVAAMSRLGMRMFTEGGVCVVRGVGFFQSMIRTVLFDIMGLTGDLMIVEHDECIPPTLSGTSVLYVNEHIHPNNTREYYVGESDGFGDRVHAHKARYPTVRHRFYALSMRTKNSAKYTETALIRWCSESSSVLLRSFGDMHHSQFGRLTAHT